MTHPRTETCESPPARYPASVWRRIRLALDDDEVVRWVGQPVAWRVTLIRAVPTGCGLAFGLVAAGVLAAVNAVLNRCGFDIWLVDVSLWVACAFSGCAFLCLAITVPSTWWAARRNGYVVTDRRALIVLSQGEVRSYSPAELRNITVRRYPDGNGEILFEYREIETREYSSDTDGASRVRCRREVHMVGFLELADPEIAKAALEALLGRELNYATASRVPANSFHFPL